MADHVTVSAEEIGQLRAAMIFRRIDPASFDRLIADLEAAKAELADVRADLERWHAALCAAERGERDEDHYR
jgi:hypothetical protein